MQNSNPLPNPFIGPAIEVTGNPFQDFLEESDVGQRANFFSRQGTRGTPTRSRFFENQFSTIQNQFLGALGAQIRGGEQPTLTFESFLNDFDLNTFFASQPPAQRGQFPSRFAPRTRTFFGF